MSLLENYNKTLKPQACPKCDSLKTCYSLTIWQCDCCGATWSNSNLQRWVVECLPGEDEPDMAIDFNEFERRISNQRSRSDGQASLQ